MRQALTRVALLAWLMLLACSQQADETVPPVSKQGGSLSVYVVNYPLQYFAERIGGENVNVSFPAPADVDPAYWSPDPETVAAYQDADLILLNGAGYAAWTKRASLPRTKLVDTSASFSDRSIALQDAVTHGHGPQGEHSHQGTAFTTWLDPTLASEQAQAITEAFAGARPEHAAVFHAGLAALEADLRVLDDRLAKIARFLGDGPVLFSHPVYQYLERRYGLNGRSLHWEPDHLPDEPMWWELRKLLPTHPARIMLWEAEPLAATRPRLRILGVRSVVYAPCSNAPSEGDWLDVMIQNADRLEAATSKSS